MAGYNKMTYEDARRVLLAGQYGVLATVDGDGTPYGVPLSYGVEGHHIYFHGAPKGHKHQNLRGRPRVSFTVVDTATPDPGHFTMLYRSVIAFGEATEVTDPAEKKLALQLICGKYGSPIDPVHIATGLPHTAVWRMDVEYLSGKTNG